MKQTNYISSYSWGVDFWRAFLERPKIIRYICKILIGRYAWNELCGLKQSIEDNGDGFYFNGFAYSLENASYHIELDNYKGW